MPNTEKNLWILTEERPKREVIQQIIELVTKKPYEIKTIKPIICCKKFDGTYEVIGIKTEFPKIIIELVSGNSGKETGSFVDFLIFQQEDSPIPEKKEKPTHAIEETKTTPVQSRNTASGQRLSKFVTLKAYPEIFDKAKKVMIWNYRTEIKKKLPNTVWKDFRKMISLDVKLIGIDKLVNLTNKKFSKFKDLDDLIKTQNSGRKPPKSNTPIKMKIEGIGPKKRLEISGKLKKGRSWSDPNMGNLSALIFLARKHKWKGNIVITKHQITQKKIDGTRKEGNKFLRIVTRYKANMSNIKLRKYEYAPYYWKKDKDKKEKIGSIFLHIAIEDNGKLEVIYENHASSEQGYIIDSNGKSNEYRKAGKKPDLVIRDDKNKQIFILEGEYAKNIRKGVKQLAGFTEFENVCKQFYPNYMCKRFVVLFGDNEFPPKMTKEEKNKVIFRLKIDGKMITYDECPQVIKDVISKLEK